MKKIQLGGHRYKTSPIKGYAIVDDSDFDWLNKYRWYLNDSGYAIHKSEKETFRMHRLILDTPKGKDTDHVNGNKLDNRRENLRIATRSQNMANRHFHKDSTSKCKGVYWNKNRKQWQVKICINYKSIFLGSFDNKIEAAKVYASKAKELFGEFALLK